MDRSVSWTCGFKTTLRLGVSTKIGTAASSVMGTHHTGNFRAFQRKSVFGHSQDGFAPPFPVVELPPPELSTGWGTHPASTSMLKSVPFNPHTTLPEFVAVTPST